MNNKTIILILFFIFSFISAAFFEKNIEKKKKWKTPIYCKYVNEIKKVFIKDVYRQYGLTYSGGGGGFLKHVELVSLYFHGQDPQKSIDESRVILINCIENLLKRINSTEKLHPYLEHSPYTYRGLKVSIGFQSSKKTDPHLVAYASNIRDQVYYNYDDREKDQFICFYEEAYEEALRIVKEQGKLELDW